MNLLMLDGLFNPLFAVCQFAPLSVERKVIGPLAGIGPVFRLTNRASPLTAASMIFRLSVIGASGRPIGKLPVASDQLSPALTDRYTLRELQASALSPCAATEYPIRLSPSPLPRVTSTQFSPLSVERKMFLDALAKSAFPLLTIGSATMLVSALPILVQARPLSVERSRTAERSEPSPSARL